MRPKRHRPPSTWRDANVWGDGSEQFVNQALQPEESCRLWWFGGERGEFVQHWSETFNGRLAEADHLDRVGIHAGGKLGGVREVGGVFEVLPEEQPEQVVGIEQHRRYDGGTLRLLPERHTRREQHDVSRRCRPRLGIDVQDDRTVAHDRQPNAVIAGRCLGDLPVCDCTSRDPPEHRVRYLEGRGVMPRGRGGRAASCRPAIAHSSGAAGLSIMASPLGEKDDRQAHL